MPKGKTRIRHPEVLATFDPSIDKPLRYFSVKESFVRSTAPQNYKLYCGQYMVMMITRSGFIYKYPACKREHDEFVESFINDYAPHVSYYKLKPLLSLFKPVYIGLPELLKL